MGKGDIKTKKGKIAKGTYGVRRKKPKNKKIVAPSTTGKSSGKKETIKEKKPAAKPTVKKEK